MTPTILIHGGRVSINGKYRNKSGSEIEITGQVPGWLGSMQVLGSLYEAVQRDSLFGNRIILVTLDGIKDCGYEKIEDAQS